MLRIIITALALNILISSCGTDESPQSPDKNQLPEKNLMDSITAEIMKAKNFQEKTQYADALRIADAMLQKYPGQLDALTIKAEIFKDQGKGAEALALMEKAYAMQPKDKETAYNLAYEYADTKNIKALSLSDTLIKYDKTETVARAWYVKATYYNNINNKKEAMRFLDSSIIANYNFTDAYFDKGQIQFEQKKYEAALRSFATGQKLAPTEAQFYFWIAKTQEAMGNKTDAKANYERAYVFDKNLVEAKQSAERL